MTPYSNVCKILGDFYTNYRDDKKLGDFFDFNDLGLPLAYFQSEGLAEVNDDGQKYILETWDLLMATIGIPDIGFENLDQLFEYAEKQQGL